MSRKATAGAPPRAAKGGHEIRHTTPRVAMRGTGKPAHARQGKPGKALEGHGVL